MRFTLRQLLLSIGLIAIGLAPISYALSIRAPNPVSVTIMIFLTSYSGGFFGAAVAVLARKPMMFWILFFTIVWVPFVVAFFVCS